MSECISRHGEFSGHEPGEGAQRFVCQRCYVFDEDAALARIAELEAAAQVAVADHARQVLEDAKTPRLGQDDNYCVRVTRALRRAAERPGVSS